jgi:hypothetical protein
MNLEEGVNNTLHYGSGSAVITSMINVRLQATDVAFLTPVTL